MIVGTEIPRELQDRVEREVEPGEQVFRMDMPVPRAFTRGSTAALLFGIPWTAFSVFWICAASGFRMPDISRGPFVLFPLFGVPFFLIGLAMLSAPLWEYRRAKKTVYVITDRRAILFAGGRSTTVRSFRPESLRELYRKDRSDGTGDVVFCRRESYDRRNRPQSEEIGFLRVRNPRDVERLLNVLAAQARPQEGA